MAGDRQPLLPFVDGGGVLAHLPVPAVGIKHHDESQGEGHAKGRVPDAFFEGDERGHAADDCAAQLATPLQLAPTAPWHRPPTSHEPTSHAEKQPLVSSQLAPTAPRLARVASLPARHRWAIRRHPGSLLRTSRGTSRTEPAAR